MTTSHDNGAWDPTYLIRVRVRIGRSENSDPDQVRVIQTLEKRRKYSPKRSFILPRIDIQQLHRVGLCPSSSSSSAGPNSNTSASFISWCANPLVARGVDNGTRSYPEVGVIESDPRAFLPDVK